MAGALGVVITTNVSVEGRHAVPAYVDESLPIVGPARAVVVGASDIPQAGGTPIAVRLAPAGTPAIGPALPIYIVAGGGVLDVMAYTNKINAMGPIAYWPMSETSGTTAQDASGNGRVGAYTGVTLGQPGIGDGRAAPTFDGATSYNNIYSASFAGAFSGAAGSQIIWCKQSAAGVWTDGVTRRAIYCLVDASNRAGLFKPTTNNEIDCLYVAGGTALGASKSTFSPTDWFHLGLTWSKVADQMIMYVNGTAITPVSNGLGVWAGALSATQTIIGSLSTAAAQVWSGSLAHAAVFNRALTAVEMASAASVV